MARPDPWHPALPRSPAPSQAQPLELLLPGLGPVGSTGPDPSAPPLLPARCPAQPLPFLGGIGGGVGPRYTLLGDAAAPNQCRAPPATGGRECFPVWVGGCFAKEHCGGSEGLPAQGLTASPTALGGGTQNPPSRGWPIGSISIKAALLTPRLCQALTVPPSGVPPYPDPAPTTARGGGSSTHLALLEGWQSFCSPKPSAKAPQTPAAQAVDIKCFIFNIKNQYF